MSSPHPWTSPLVCWFTESIPEGIGQRCRAPYCGLRYLAGMAERIGTVGSVVINAADYEGVKSFWRSFLAVGVAREFPGFCWLDAQHEGGVSVAIQQTDDPGPLTGRVHLDTGVEDLDEAQSKIEALGGSHLENHEIMGFHWRIMADPEGNRFCIAAA